jgi:hypothetical protein
VDVLFLYIKTKSLLAPIIVYLIYSHLNANKGLLWIYIYFESSDHLYECMHTDMDQVLHDEGQPVGLHVGEWWQERCGGRQGCQGPPALTGAEHACMLQ